MSNGQQLYHTVTRVILSQCPPPRITQTRDSAWFITGVNGLLCDDSALRLRDTRLHVVSLLSCSIPCANVIVRVDAETSDRVGHCEE